ncbi:MAG: gene transfer agent family protein [Bosea sp.]|uniref:gene transfer agent family protein n=1 Tax=Bosea sp. (in: a-proteobacteria) TaxID=1871050 RepID=UPI001AC5B913|nr:gene transfer agent family protein [Bosea sp. (in: a-proteobacteria)]MBN9472267.1 gene transfer agent family protein [Bosea sp. (in: a-proteobacteria)]
MSLCAIDFDWADGHYTFALPIAQLEELQRLCDAGPMVVAERLRHGVWKIEDIHATLRLGLIGGGMEPIAALRLVKTYVHDRPWGENVLPALAIINAALFGKPDEPVGKSPADGEESDPPARTESSISETSTASAS